MNYLIKQAKFIPLLFFVPVTIAGFLVPSYSMIKQQGSEITLTTYKTAIFILESGALLSGLSGILLALGIMLKYKRFYLSSVILIVFSISMISNGLFPMGSPMHGFYGIGLSLMLLPFISCYELKNEMVRKTFFKISIISGFVMFIYFWSTIVGLDPQDYQGLTQRIAAIFMFGWIAYLAYELEKSVSM
ncbi:DUF998 domain-containing protein [Aequorivita flava]|uniref:DUF998 domain-containing protein n=1 Tax=Aequorivita flava TaxID=3114371 RepID=A0AB35YZ85_9FLAO